MESCLLLDVAVGEGPSDLKLFPLTYQTLLVGGNAFPVLDLLLHVVDRIRKIHLQCSCLATEGSDEDLEHAGYCTHLGGHRAGNPIGGGGG